MLITLPAAFLIGVGGCNVGPGTGISASTTPPAEGDHRLVLRHLGRIPGCLGIGHSGIEGYGVPPQDAFVTKVCDGETGQVLNLGIGGSTLQGDLDKVLGYIPADTNHDLSIVMWGVNDLALYGPHLAGFRAGLELLVSRLRTPASAIHGVSSAQLTFRGPWVRLGSLQTTKAGATVSWLSPRGFPGGELSFITSFQYGTGALVTASLDGAPAGALDTRSLAQPPPAPQSATAAAVRIAVPSGAGHRVLLQFSQVQNEATFEGWSLESAHPSLVVLVEHPQPPSFAIYDTGGWPFRPDDTQVRALDAVIGQVARSFGPSVITVNPDPLFRSNPADFLASDQFHFSVRGNAIVAAAIERAIRSNPEVEHAMAPRWLSR